MRLNTVAMVILHLGGVCIYMNRTKCPYSLSLGATAIHVWRFMDVFMLLLQEVLSRFSRSVKFV